MPAKTFAAVLVVCLLSHLAAQTPITVIQGTDQVSASRAVINTNFATLATGKVSRFSGTGAPGSIALSIQGDVYNDTTNLHTYICYSVLCSSSPNWVRVDSINTLPPFVPTFNAGGITRCNWAISPTCQNNFGAGDTTLDAINPVSGATYTVISVEDAVGGRKYTAFPANFKGAAQPDLGANNATVQDFVFDGTNYQGKTATCPLCSGITIPGATSGQITLGVPAVAGAAHRINFPTAPGTLGQVPTTDGGSPTENWTYSTPAGGGGGTINVGGQGVYYGPFGAPTGMVDNNAVTQHTDPRYAQFVMPFNITPSKLAVYVNTLTTNPSHLAAAIYDAAGTLLTNGATTTATISATLGKYLVFPTPPTLLQGVAYHIGFTVDTAETMDLMQAYGDAGGVTEALANQAGALRFFTAANQPTGSAGTLAMPGTIGARTVSIIFPVFFELLP